MRVEDAKVALYVGNATDSVNYYAHEADRFAAAAFESVITKAVCGELPRSYGWLLIQAYYAAFFATHALFRLAGWACTRLTSENLRFINDEIKTIYGGAPLAGGLYLLKCLDGGRQLTCEPLGAFSGGSHEALWTLMPSYLAHIRSLALGASNVDADDTAPIERLESFVKAKGGPNWFSTVRNRLNYSHGYGAWHPYVKSTCAPEQIGSALDAWRGDIDGSGIAQGTDELMHFARACALLVGFCRLTTRDLAERSKARSPFRCSSARLIALGAN
ncbi:putative membrane associated protein [Cupriavidus necator]|uniref:Hypothetical membrane associated protein n=1 Tax=Cupriavidus necator (strain ATCC 17699 / DSM 428 / KCTC 22496 / NCIMB 10442 / H16 / Stanier 337) TaxID=381666 RepID=Q0K6R4_CUPNH|nr:hypothetical membrane associated protein [Cupriavidus necator H16]